MRAALFPLVLCLFGCGGAEQAPRPDHGFGYLYDLASPDGTRLRNDPAFPLSDADFETLIAEPYRDVERCAQIVTGGPLVIVVTPETIAPKVGRAFITGDPLILISSEYVRDDRVLRHEYVHYLLAVSDFPEGLNSTHQSPLFLQCSGYAPF